jgi:hypothetical protein
VEPRAAQVAVMSDGAKGPFYRSAWITEASGGRWAAGGEFNSVDFEE